VYLKNEYSLKEYLTQLQLLIIMYTYF